MLVTSPCWLFKAPTGRVTPPSICNKRCDFMDATYQSGVGCVKFWLLYTWKDRQKRTEILMALQAILLMTGYMQLDTKSKVISSGWPNSFAHDWIHAACVTCSWLDTCSECVAPHTFSTTLNKNIFIFYFITSRRTLSLSGTASIKPASLALALAKSSMDIDSQSLGKKGVAILTLENSWTHELLQINRKIKTENKSPRDSPAGTCLWMVVVCSVCDTAAR